LNLAENWADESTTKEFDMKEFFAGVKVGLKDIASDMNDTVEGMKQDMEKNGDTKNAKAAEKWQGFISDMMRPDGDDKDVED